MTDIDFHIFTSEARQPVLQMLCKLVEQAYREKNQQVFIHAGDRETAEAIDELLWTYDKYKFLPHNILGDGPNKTPPIQIGYDGQVGKQSDFLINLSDEVPSFFSHFHRVAELVAGEESLKAKARDRYRFYQQRGYPLRHFSHE